MKLCHCGQPLHYSDPAVQAVVERMIEKLGEMTIIAVEGRVWRVPRHYIALHGLEGAQVEHLGFEEIESDTGRVNIQNNGKDETT